MKADRYTKTVLTVIAACMVINLLKEVDILPKAYANEPSKPVTTPAPAPNYAVVPLNADGSINVKNVSNTPTDVNIVGIRTSDDLDVNVNLEKIGGSYTSGEIPVRVKQ
jgi:hypothetical protein